MAAEKNSNTKYPLQFSENHNLVELPLVTGLQSRPTEFTSTKQEKEKPSLYFYHYIINFEVHNIYAPHKQEVLSFIDFPQNDSLFCTIQSCKYSTIY